MELDPAEARLLCELEQRLMHPSVRASPDQVARLLADDHGGRFGSPGRHTPDEASSVATEMALHVLAYNLTRVMNIMGIQPLIQAS